MLKKMLASRDEVITGTITFDNAVYDEANASAWQKLKRITASLLGIGLLLGLSWALVGTPYVRWDQPLANGKDGAVLNRVDLAFTRYVTCGDSRRVHAGEYGEGLPWLIFIPLQDTFHDDCGSDACRTEASSFETSTPSSN